MFKSFQLILILALGSVVAHPSPAGAQDLELIFSDLEIDLAGGASEELLIAFNLRERPADGGVRQTPPSECETASFRITAREASGSSAHVATEVVAVSPGFGAVATIDFSAFATSGQVHVTLAFSEFRRSGRCHFLRPFYRIVDGVTGATLSSGHFPAADDTGQFWFIDPANWEPVGLP